MQTSKFSHRFSLTKFSLTNFPCQVLFAHVYGKDLAIFVQKLVMPAFQQRKLFVCTVVKKNWTGNYAVRHCTLIFKEFKRQLAFLKAKIRHFWGTVCPRESVLDNQNNVKNDFSYTLCIMPRLRSAPGNESHQNKAGVLRFAF